MMNLVEEIADAFITGIKAGLCVLCMLGGMAIAFTMVGAFVYGVSVAVIAWVM